MAFLIQYCLPVFRSSWLGPSKKKEAHDLRGSFNKFLYRGNDDIWQSYAERERATELQKLGNTEQHKWRYTKVVFRSVKQKIMAKRGSTYCCRLKICNASFIFSVFNITAEVVHQMEKLLSFLVHSQCQCGLYEKHQSYTQLIGCAHTRYA